MNEGDAQLVRAVRSGRREAFDGLVERYQRQAFAVAYRLIGNNDDALDVVQDGFVRAYAALEQLAEPSRFGPWLMRIMANTALNFRRKRARQPRFSLDQTGAEDIDAPRDRLPGREASPEEQADAHELSLAMEQAILELPEKLRAPLVLFAVERMPQKEIAEMLGCSVQTVKWSVFEARRRLRVRLQKLL